MSKRETNCPNCGAPIEHYYNYKCKYCGTFLYNTNENIKNFKNCDVTDIKVHIEISAELQSIIITIVGRTTPKMYYLEECELNSIVVSSDDLYKKVGFKIEIPYWEYRNYTYDRLVQRVINNLPEPFEKHYQEIISQIIEISIENHIINKKYEELGWL